MVEAEATTELQNSNAGDTQTSSEVTQRIPVLPPTPPIVRPVTPKAARLKPITVLRPLLFVAVLMLAAYFRFTGINWDQSQHLHPDERYMTFLVSQLTPVNSLKEYFDPEKSTLNPFNTDWGRGYVYGTLPLFSTRYLAEWLDKGCGENGNGLAKTFGQLLVEESKTCNPPYFSTYDPVTSVGRFLSGLYDLITVFFTLLIGWRLFGWRVGLLGGLLNAAAVLQIQQGHYFTVDSMALMFVTASIYGCTRLATSQLSSMPKVVGFWLTAMLTGLSAGLAVACKISAWPTAALMIVSVVIALARDKRSIAGAVVDAALALILGGVIAFAGLRVAQPYAFVGASQSEFQITVERCINAAGTEPDVFSKVCKVTADLPKPLRELVMPTTRWIEQLRVAEGFATGRLDAPFAILWADRMPIVFPWMNMVFWGMGIALGLASWLGLFYAIRQMLRGRRWWAYAPVVLWSALYFLYQSTQWTKSLRYLVLTYPTFCVLAAVGLVAVWRWGSRRQMTSATIGGQWSVVDRLSRIISVGLPILAVIGTLAWAFAFMAIYSEPITRVTASRWMYKNIPSAATLHWNGAKGMTQLPAKDLTLVAGSAPNPIELNLRNLLPPGEAEISGPYNNIRITLNKLNGSGKIKALLMDASANQPVQEITQEVSPQKNTLSFDKAVLDPVHAYYVQFSVPDDVTNPEPITARTSIIANEHWDDGLPVRMDMKDGFGMFYNGLPQAVSADGQIQNYMEEDPGKDLMQVGWLDSADYLVMSSNRLYGSTIPRMPWRYQAASEYYRAIFDGRMGFELIGEYTSFPRLGPFTFDNNEMPETLIRPENYLGKREGEIMVPYPKAEETFSVYDHPRVLIWKKTAKYNTENATRILTKYDLTRTLKQMPFQARNAPFGMLIDPKSKAVQEAGGTWAELYPRNSPVNQSETTAVIAWLALIEVLGLMVFPLIALSTTDDRRPFVVGRFSLADGGYSFAKTLGILLVAFSAWVLGSLKLTQVTPTLLWVLVAVLAALGLHFWYHRRADMIGLIRARWKVLLASEIVFLLAFFAWLAVRSGNPDIWHPYMGGEKPMDFAYLNAVLKSSYFPPIDPWFAGGYINYYYFGWVVIGWPIKALGIDPAVAYNIALPTLFALTGVGAFGVGATLAAFKSGGGGVGKSVVRSVGSVKSVEGVGHIDTSDTSDTSDVTSSPHPFSAKRAIIAGVLAAVFAIGMGNGQQIRVMGPAMQKLGGIDEGKSGITAFVDGFGKWWKGEPLPIYPNWPYWNATRPTEDLPGNPVMIAEFPQFTFLYADLHAHMMAMPLAYLVLAFALAFAGGGRKWPALVMGAIASGALWPANTWDYYPYMLLCIGGLFAGTLPTRFEEDQSDGEKAGLIIKGFLKVLPIAIIFFALTRAFYIPYLESYGSAYNQIDPWTAERTPVHTYIMIYGTFMIPLALFAIITIYRNMLATKSLLTHIPTYVIAAGVLGGAYLWLKDVPIAFMAALMLALSLAVALAPKTPNQNRVMWLMSTGAFAITIFVELFVLRGDIARMNTVFKFYIVAWLLLSAASAAATVQLFDLFVAMRPVPQPTPIPPENIQPTLPLDLDTPGTAPLQTPPLPAPFDLGGLLRPVFSLAMVVAIFLALLYPAFAIPGKIKDRYVPTMPAGLNGMSYMLQADRMEGLEVQRNFPLKWDYDAIKWMQDNVKGSPTIIEEGAARGNQYRWSARFSIYTGLPAVVGWQWHQMQQRASIERNVVEDRVIDVHTFYSTPDIETAQLILRRYDVKYVILGQMEEIYNDAQGIPKFEQMERQGLLKRVYKNDGTIIFEVLKT